MYLGQNLSSLLLKVSVVSADITISGKLFHTFVRGSKSPKSTISPCDIQHIYIIAVSTKNIAYQSILLLQ